MVNSHVKQPLPLVRQSKRAHHKPAYYLRHSVTYFFLILFALIVLLPLIWITLSAFKEEAQIQSDPFGFPTSFDYMNFVNAWTRANMGGYFLNSIILTVGGLVVLIVFAVPTAYVLSRFKFRLARVLSLLFMAGLFVNVNYIVTPMYVMLLSVSRSIGLGMGLVDNLVTVIFVYAATSFSFTIYLLSGYFKTMPKGYEEAAKIDGCGYMRTLVQISIPLAMPSIMTVVLFNFLSYWNEYMVAMTFLSEARRTLPVGLLSLVRESKAAADLGRQYAGLLMVMVPVLVVYCFVQGQLTKGLTLGGLKG